MVKAAAFTTIGPRLDYQCIQIIIIIIIIMIIKIYIYFLIITLREIKRTSIRYKKERYIYIYI